MGLTKFILKDQTIINLCFIINHHYLSWIPFFFYLFNRHSKIISFQEVISVFFSILFPDYLSHYCLYYCTSVKLLPFFDRSLFVPGAQFAESA